MLSDAASVIGIVPMLDRTDGAAPAIQRNSAMVRTSKLIAVRRLAAVEQRWFAIASRSRVGPASSLAWVAWMFERSNRG
jgi:hypothetical protein